MFHCFCFLLFEGANEQDTYECCFLSNRKIKKLFVSHRSFDCCCCLLFILLRFTKKKNTNWICILVLFYSNISKTVCDWIIYGYSLFNDKIVLFFLYNDLQTQNNTRTRYYYRCGISYHSSFAFWEFSAFYNIFILHFDSEIHILNNIILKYFFLKWLQNNASPHSTHPQSIQHSSYITCTCNTSI